MSWTYRVCNSKGCTHGKVRVLGCTRECKHEGELSAVTSHKRKVG